MVRERSCTRCQSFHRHHHRHQRRRSSGLQQHTSLRSDFSSTPTSSSLITKAVVTINSPQSSAPSSTLLPTNAAMSGSNLTISSVPPSLMLGATSPNLMPKGSLSAANTPLATTPAAKHCTFALTPTTIPANCGQISLLGNSRNKSLSQRNLPNSTASDPYLSDQMTQINENRETASVNEMQQHENLTMRHSVQSQMTTMEDIEDEQNDLDRGCLSSGSDENSTA